MPRVQLSGGAYQARSVIASAQRSLNLYAEPLPQQQGEPSPQACYPTPGLRLLATLPQGPVRGIKQTTTGGIYAVAGSGVYLLDPNAWTNTLIGSITPMRPYPVSMQDNGNTLAIVDGTANNGWTVDLASHAFAAINDPAFYGADRVDFLDTYLLFNKPGTPQFYVSGSLATTFDSLDFANKESFSDLLITLAVAKREIWLLGERTTEIWYDAGATDTGAGSFQFAQIQSVFVDHGCRAKYSVATYDDAVYWLSYDRAGQGIVLSGAGYQTKRISTFAIEAELTKYTRIDDAIGFVYSLAGHVFYVLTFPHADHTWVYDITTQQWHEWLWIDDNGEEHRHRANCCYAINGMVVVGDWQNGNLYAVEVSALTDNGQPIKRQRSYPHIINQMDRVYYRQFIADIESGNPGSSGIGVKTLLSCSFTAPNGTLLSAYSNTSDTNAVWTLVSGVNAVIEGNELVGPSASGACLYHSPSIATTDYTLQFRAVPTDYIVVGTSGVFAIARTTGAGTGYRAAVTGDGTQYQLTLGIEGGGATTLAMGTIASGFYTVTMALSGTAIALSAQRSSDGLYLQPSGLWGAGGVPAITLADGTYTAAGYVMIGGAWVVMAPLTATIETPLASNPNFPSGYSSQLFGRQTFDFTRNRFYQPISDSSTATGGIAVTDLTTMVVIETPTMAQMYAGTPYGSPAGSPPGQDIFDAVCGNGTDLYILTVGNPAYTPAAEFTRFTRIDPTTMKVNGEFYTSNSFPPPITCVMLAGGTGSWSAVNTTTAHTIVAYQSNASLGIGPQIFDGTNMAPIGIGPTPLLGIGANLWLIPGAKRGDGSCDFLMLNSDDAHPTTGHIDIWRINVSDSLVITSTKTGTVNTLSVFTPGARFFISQADYDITHDAIILMVTNSTVPNGTPAWLMSVNYNGTINWSDGPLSQGGGFYSKGQSLLNGTSYTFGDTTDLTMIDTATGATTFTGSISVAGSSGGAYYRVWDASRQSYWTLALARGFTRIDVHDPSVAMDNLLVFDTTKVVGDLIWLDWSDDRGHSYGNPVSQPIGATGAYLTSVQWQRLAYARDRVFRLTWSAPVATALQGAFIEVAAAKS